MRRLGGRGTPAAAPSTGQHIGDLLQDNRQDVPDLRPAVPGLLRSGQVRAAARTVHRGRDRLGAVRLLDGFQPHPLAALLPARLAVLRASTRGQVGPPPGLRRDRVLRGGLTRVRRIPPQPPLQIGDFQPQLIDHAGLDSGQRGQVLVRRLLRHEDQPSGPSAPPDQTIAPVNGHHAKQSASGRLDRALRPPPTEVEAFEVEAFEGGALLNADASADLFP
jgi:hypothetical protein